MKEEFQFCPLFNFPSHIVHSTKGKVEQFRERSSVLSVVAIEKGAQVALDYSSQLYLLIFIPLLLFSLKLCIQS